MFSVFLVFIIAELIDNRFCREQPCRDSSVSSIFSAHLITFSKTESTLFEDDKKKKLLFDETSRDSHLFVAVILSFDCCTKLHNHCKINILFCQEVDLKTDNN